MSDPMEPVVVARYWRARRRLRPLVVRPRSRKLLDRCGLIVRVMVIQLPRHPHLTASVR